MPHHQRSGPAKVARVSCLLLTCAVALPTIVSCGHPATKAECEEIIERMMRLQAQEKQLDTGLDEKVEVAKEDLTKECVGKRITDGALECVRNAKTAAEIREDCF